MLALSVAECKPAGIVRVARPRLPAEADPLDEFLGADTGVCEGFDLDVLRDERA